MPVKQSKELQSEEWFTQWFNSYYHILYKDRDQHEARLFIDNLARFLDFSPKNKILDLACGRGRHSVYLNSGGFDVTGIDLSPKTLLTPGNMKMTACTFTSTTCGSLSKTMYSATC